MGDFLSHVIGQLGSGSRAPPRPVMAGGGAGAQQVYVQVASAAVVRLVQVRGRAAGCCLLLQSALLWRKSASQARLDPMQAFLSNGLRHSLSHFNRLNSPLSRVCRCRRSTRRPTRRAPATAPPPRGRAPSGRAFLTCCRRRAPPRATRRRTRAPSWRACSRVSASHCTLIHRS